MRQWHPSSYLGKRCMSWDTPTHLAPVKGLVRISLVGGIPCRWGSLHGVGRVGHECKQPGPREAVLGICEPFAEPLPPHCGSGERSCQAEGICLVQSVPEELWCQAPAWCEPVQPFLCKCPSGGLRLSTRAGEVGMSLWVVLSE